MENMYQVVSISMIKFVVLTNLTYFALYLHMLMFYVHFVDHGLIRPFSPEERETIL